MDLQELRSSFNAVLINPAVMDVPRRVLGTAWQGHKTDPVSELVLRLQNLRDDYEYFDRGVYKMTKAEFWASHEPIAGLVEKHLIVRRKGEIHVNEESLQRIKDAGFRFIYEPAHSRWVIEAGGALMCKKVVVLAFPKQVAALVGPSSEGFHTIPAMWEGAACPR